MAPSTTQTFPQHIFFSLFCWMMFLRIRPGSRSPWKNHHFLGKQISKSLVEHFSLREAPVDFFVCLSSPRFVKHPCILKALEIQNEVQVFFCISLWGWGDCRFPRLIRVAHKVSSCYIYHFPFRTSRPFQPLQTSEPVQKLLAFQDRVVVSRTHKFWRWFEVWDRGADWLVWILHPISSQFHTIVAFFGANGRRAGINHVIYSWNNLS